MNDLQKTILTIIELGAIISGLFVSAAWLDKFAEKEKRENQK